MQRGTKVQCILFEKAVLEHKGGAKMSLVSAHTKLLILFLRSWENKYFLMCTVIRFLF